LNNLKLLLLLLALQITGPRSVLADCSGPQFDAPHFVGSINTTKITEASGIAVSRAHPGVLYTHNDGNSGKFYAITTNAQLLATFDPGKSVDDTEDIAVGPGPDSSKNYIYLADIGSNSETRNKIKLVRMPEPSVDLSWAQDPVNNNVSDADGITLLYPDGGTYNAETLMIDSNLGELFIATKQTGKSRIYRARLGDLSTKDDTVLEFVREIPLNVANGGDISADGRYIAIRNETSAYLWIKQPNQSAAEALGGPATALPIIGKPGEPNGEAIAFVPDGSGYYTLSEGQGQPLFFIPRLSAGSSGTPQFDSAPQLTPEGWRINISACAGATVSLLKSTDLRNWQTASTHQLTSDRDTFFDPAGNIDCFYRLQVLSN
jgi:hypothetical protein